MNTSRLQSLDGDAVLVVADSSRDPDLAPFVGQAHLGECFVLATRSDVWLAYFTPMEREEASKTGLQLLDPTRLGVSELRDESADAGAFWRSILERGLEAAGIEPGFVGLAGRGPLGHVYLGCRQLESDGWRFHSAHETILGLRKTKTIPEINAARSAAQGTVAAFRRVAGLLRECGVEGSELWSGAERLRAATLRQEIAIELAAHGLQQPLGNIVGAGREAGIPHSTGDDSRVLHTDETIIVDLFPSNGLFADCTRTFCVGRASANVRTAHSEVHAVLEAAQKSAKPGVSGWSLQEQACARLGEAGYPTPLSEEPASTVGYVHNLGHGVGFEIHEYPTFRSVDDERGTLSAGDLITLEPGLYDPEAGYGVRLEDLCLVREDGVETLTPLPYELDPKAWPAS